MKLKMSPLLCHRRDSEQLTHKYYTVIIQHVTLKLLELKDDPSFCFGSVVLKLIPSENFK